MEKIKEIYTISQIAEGFIFKSEYNEKVSIVVEVDDEKEAWQELEYFLFD